MCNFGAFSVQNIDAANTGGGEGRLRAVAIRPMSNIVKWVNRVLNDFFSLLTEDLQVAFSAT